MGHRIENLAGFLTAVGASLSFACSDANHPPFGVSGTAGDESSGHGSSAGASVDDTGAPGSSSSGPADDTSHIPVLDVGNFDLPDHPQGCSMSTPADVDPDDVGSCNDQAPPNSFDAEVQWAFEAGESYHAPLVVNLTDDNGNGEIDVCDTPDVILHTGTAFGTLHILDGATGMEHFTIEAMLDPNTTPAVGDIDNDGLPEIVAAAGIPFAATLVAFEHDGTPKWTSNAPFSAMAGSAVGIANLDNAGFPEVYVANVVVDGNTGAKVMNAPAGFDALTAPVAADLDGDHDLEFIRGADAYHHDGTPYYVGEGVAAGFPQIGNLDDDDDPEVLIISMQGITVLEHDGTPKYQNVRPTGDPAGFSWYRPATIHDFDGDGKAEFAVSSASHYAAYHADTYEVMWIADVQDPSGVAAGTAFDFLGDGTAEAIFADEYKLFAFDVTGTPLMEVDRSSGTLIEYPVVADIDNDGAAEALVVSNKNFENQQLTPTLQAIRDSQDRWIQARRIWNQHTYHVTNVNEDGTIPVEEPPSWKLLNTYRTNAQIEGGAVCVPPAG